MRSLNMGAHKLELVVVQQLVQQPRPPARPHQEVRNANR